MARQASPARLLLKTFDQSLTPIYLVSAERKLQYANEACCQWLGKKLPDLIGLRCDFTATSTRDGQAAVANSLGPPPAAFEHGCTTGEICGGPDGSPTEVRTATFQALSGAAGVLVFVGAANTAAPDGHAMDLAPRLSHLQLLQLRSELDPALLMSPLIGQSHAIRRLREQVKVAQHANVRVMLIGPTGSGRRQLARAIHYVGDVNQVGPLAAVDCPVMDAELMQLTLTRFLKQREGTTFRRPPALLLTDVDQLRADAQQELAGFLLLPGVELQTISTASRSLHKLAARGRFRQDLAFALSTFTLNAPPLSKRLEDVPLLAQYFLEQHNARGGTQHGGFVQDALELLLLYPWPGNIDELAAMVKQACATASGAAITAADLPPQVHHGREALLHQNPAEPSINLPEFLAEVEKELLQRALRKANGNKTKAAELLGLQRGRLIRRLVQLGLMQPQVQEEEAVVFEPIQPEKGSP
ncbi:sigma 54-interacting transcriptional regulator [Anatilimnocola floriformis]|uniref:sigma 54-interacting transcriptional regulator n=1 Tax=Anatilimnocola floriformis TaxID=2948575 RepID=UPI0020C2F448|nr:sigma 54-interacting transcriptional regulator [Anatilimnocola floriformis]